MPTRPPRVCPGCGDAVHGPCPTCTPRTGWAARPSASARGRNTRRWARVRRNQLAAEPLCRTCGAVAHEVDHIVTIAAGGARYDYSNLQSLCVPCHRKKTVADAARARAAHRAQHDGDPW